MYKTNASFRMDRTIKRMLSLMPRQEREQCKALYIEAQCTYEEFKRKPIKKESSDE